MALLDDIKATREDLQTARAGVTTNLFIAAEARRVLDEARRSGQGITEAEVALGEAEDHLQEAAEIFDGHKTTLAGQLGQWAPQSLTPTDEILRLEAQYPIVFLPVRIETRFALAENKLRIRVYPDDIFGSTHEEQLTPLEHQAGLDYYGTVGPGAPQSLLRWQTLLQGRTPERAAWIVEAVGRERAPGKSDGWTRAVEADLLPDRFIAVGTRADGSSASAVGHPVQEPLRLTHDPSTDASEAVGGLEMDPELKWTVDFQTALDAGMGLELPATGAGFDRVLVFGVKGSMDPATSTFRLSQLQRDHRYSRGVALIRQGTPTNNTAGRDAGYPPDDQGGVVSFGELRGGLERFESDGVTLGKTLGLAPLTLDDVSGANGREQRNAKDMNTALWPVSFGYFLQHMLDPVHSALPRIFALPTVEQARTHFIDHVRGRGACPAFRIGGTPYGVMGVSSLDRWKAAAGASGLDLRLPGKLKQLRDLWLAKAKAGVPRVGKNPDAPDDDLLRIIGLHPSTRQVRVRAVLGDTFQRTLFQLTRRDWGPVARALAENARRTFELISEATWNVRIGRATLSAAAPLFKHPLVAPEPLSEELDVEGKPLQEHSEDRQIIDNYIDWLRTAEIEQIRDHQRTPVPQSLFYYVLRHSVLTEYARLLYEFLVKEDASRLVLELMRILFGTDQQTTIWQRFAEPHAPNQNRGQFIRDSRALGYRQALSGLAELSQAEIERLFSETLDVASHRLDAWITSLYNKRLLEHRNQVVTKNPDGIVPLSYLGAFAWVEDLRPGPLTQQSGGFIHAPSTAHAATAAVLRSGFVTRKPEAAGRFAFDLTSSRVRNARALLEAVRAGQPAGAVLGYRFERALHEAARDRLIDPFRRRYPLVANKAGLSSDPAQAVAARSVVDGLSLRAAWQGRTNDEAFFATITIAPALTAAEKAALLGPLNALDEALDGVADLLTAESVYQMVRGNTAGAAAPLEALAAGAQPPDPEVARTPRGGSTANHRVGVLWSGANPTGGEWATVSTRRAEAEPLLDDWVGRILGRPDHVLAWVTFKDGGQTRRVAVSFKDLEVRPLDVLELASEAPEVAQVTAQELERRALQAAVEKQGAQLEEIAVDFNPAAGDGFDRASRRTFPDLLDLARQVTSLLSQARSARPVDLLPVDGVEVALSPSEQEETPLAGDVLVDGLKEGDLAELQAAITAGSGPGLRTALRRAAQYTVGAFPDPRESDAELRTRAELTRDELIRRVEQGERLLPATGEGPPEVALAIYRAVFGRTFLRLPRFTLQPAAGKEVERSASGLVLSTHEPGRFLRQNARVRSALASWRKLWLYAEAAGAPAPVVDVAQLPFVEGEKWVGDDGTPAGNRLSLVAARGGSARPDLEQPAAGLIIDQWTEVIPNSEEQTGVTFQYDNPGAEAAQTILVAVRPDPAQTHWALDDITAILGETLDLAKIRAVEPELLGETRQALPALYLTTNVVADPNAPHPENVSTDFSGLVRGQAVRMPRSV